MTPPPGGARLRPPADRSKDKTLSLRLRALLPPATWLLAASVRGQAPPTGSLYGNAGDPRGEPVPGATATLTGPGAARTAATDPRGDFHFLGLSPGDYALRLERPGFETARRGVTIVPGKSAVLSIALAVAGAAEEVTVSGDAPALDSRTIRTGASFGEKELESIPTTRDPWAIVRQVPGVLVAGMNVGGVSPGQPPFVGKGTQSNQNSYSLDGVAVSANGVSPFFYDFDSFSSVEVATGGSDLSLSTPGVTINLVTKRGTNELRGSARGLYTFDSGWDYGVEAGGPVRKDRLWVWGAFAHNDFLSTDLTNLLDEPIESRQTLKHWNAKANAEVLRGNALTLSYTDFHRVLLGFQADPFRSKESNWNNLRPSLSYRIDDSQVLSKELFASAYLSYVKTRSVSTPVGGVDEQADADAVGIFRHSFKSRRILDDKHQAGADVRAFFDTGAWKHELRLGFGYRHLRFDSNWSWPGDQLVGYKNFQEADITRLQNARALANVYDAVLGDTIAAGNLTISVGARFDYQQGRNLPSEVPANPVFPEILPAVHYPGDSGYPITWRQVQPRVGLTYSLGGNRTLLRVSYARFGNEIDSSTVIVINAFPSIAEIGYGWTDPNGNGRVEPGEIDFDSYCCAVGVDPDHPGSSVQVNRIAADYVTPTTDEFLVGAERQIAPGFTGSLAYTYRISRRLDTFTLIGTSRASYQFVGNASGTAVDPETGFVLDFREPYYRLADCPAPCVGFLLENRRGARETYSGVELQLVKSLSHGWMARAGFAYNGLRQRVGAGIADPNDRFGADIDAAWQFNVSGMVQLPLGIAAGVNVFGRQGFPILYSVDAVTDDVNAFVRNVPIGKATRYRTPDVFEVDMQLSKVFRIGSSLLLIPQVGCFNLLDSRTVLERSGFAGTYEVVDGTPRFRQVEEGFNAVLNRLGKRAFRVGARVTF